MSKAKIPKPEIQATREIKSEKESRISISFQYLTTNKNFNFEVSKKKSHDKLHAFKYLVEFLKRLTSKTMKDIINFGKKQDCGFETLEFKQIEFSPNNYTLCKDEKIYSFRFGAGDGYRMLVFFEYNQTVLNIIGFDFNHSAYDHE